MNEIYISTDIETDGKIPGVSSMVSLASAAYRGDKTLVSTFTVNLLPLPDANPDPETMAWWNTQPDAWKATQVDPKDPSEAMRLYLEWVKSLPGTPVFVAYPAGFDFLFVYWYLIRFTSESPFAHSAIDIKTYAMAMLKSEYRRSGKSNMPKHWFDELPHRHIALDDAIEQGALFCNMLAENGLGGFQEP